MAPAIFVNIWKWLTDPVRRIEIALWSPLAILMIASVLIWGQGQNFPGLTAGSMPSSLYTLSESGGITIATPNSSSLPFIANTDASVVLNSIFVNNSSTCGEIFVKNGDYTFNSVTQETTGGYTNWYYAVAFPANAGSANQYCQWRIVGEQAQYTSGTAEQAQGVIFDFTSTAVNACGSGNECVAWWHRPDTTNHVGNDITFENITTRFPNNTRGNEAAYLMWEAGTVDFENCTATLATNIGSPNSPNISPAVAGANHMIGFSTTMSVRNNWQIFRKTWAVGYDIGYDVESEHAHLDSATALLGNYGFYYGRLGTFGSYSPGGPVHPAIWEKVTDQDNIHGTILGSAMNLGTRLDVLDYDIEYVSTGSFARSTNFTETNIGYTSGLITYTTVLGASGIVGEIPSANLFSAGGTQFTILEGTTGPNLAQTPAIVAFSAYNNIASGLGPAWQSWVGVSSNCAVSSGNAQPSATNDVCIEGNIAQVAAVNQFSVITVGKITSSGAVDATVLGSGTNNSTDSFYEYACSTSGSATLAKRGIYYVLNGAAAVLLVQTSANSGCVATDTMELQVTQSGGTNTLCAYHNGTPDSMSGGSGTNTNCITDTHVLTGQPGLNVVLDTGTGISNWQAGSLYPIYTSGTLTGWGKL